MLVGCCDNIYLAITDSFFLIFCHVGFIIVGSYYCYDNPAALENHIKQVSFFKESLSIGPPVPGDGGEGVLPHNTYTGMCCSMGL